MEIVAMESSLEELAARQVEPSSVVDPTEDVVQALMETLVDPLLPLRVSNVPPSENVQKSVAKQMHAVVLLYNYHHRKQNPKLLFLKFANFCKLAVVLRPPLISFMKMMMEDESTKSSDSKNELSLTEKAIKNACDIAASLDASQEFPNTQELPISKVATVLIDSEKENCTLIETSIKQEISSEERVGNKRKQNAPNHDSEFLQLGYDSVNKATGIASFDLEVLEKHVTYSLTEKKSAVCFYMMRCLGSFTINEQVPLEFVVERLQGPVAEKVDFGMWKTTPVAEFHHMLPYVSFISCWFSGGTRNLENLANDQKKKDFVSGPSSGLPEKTETIADVDDDVIEKFNNTHDAVNFPTKEESMTEPKILDKGNDECDEDNSLSDPTRELKTIDSTQTCTKREETSKKLNSITRVYHHRKKNNSSEPNKDCVSEDGASLKVNMVESLNSYQTQCKDEKVSGDKGDDVTISYDQTGISGIGNQILQFKAKTKYNVQSLSSDPEDLQNALSLLHRKRQEHHSRICSMEDTLALYEDNIARIRDGGDVVLARECIKSIVSGNYNLLLEHGTQKQDNEKIRLPETYLPGKSSCQDLEYACLMNNWRMPRYLLESSDGKFVAYVVVEGKDFKLHSNGGFESKPREARESAAVQMIAKIQNSCV